MAYGNGNKESEKRMVSLGDGELTDTKFHALIQLRDAYIDNAYFIKYYLFHLQSPGAHCMALAQRHFTTLAAPVPLLSPFLQDAERERPLLDSRGRLHTMLNVDIRGSCRHLSNPAEAIFRQVTGFQGHAVWADQPEADVLMAGLVDWHHDHGACFNPLRMLIAFPAIEGFVVDISSKTHDQMTEADIDSQSESDIKNIISASIPLTLGAVFFLNHDIWHRVRFTGDPAMLEGAPCTFFYDFSLNEEAYSRANAP